MRATAGLLWLFIRYCLIILRSLKGSTNGSKLNQKALEMGELGFQYVKTDFRYSAVFQDGNWLPGTLISEENILIHEGAPSLHYAQQCFEGMKAQTTQDGRVVLFRPALNSERMNRTASRLLMPEVPQVLFITAVEEAVRANYSWIPPYGSGASLYIRPMLIGVGENLGLNPAQSFEFRVFVSPVGPYYKSAGLAAISLAVSDFDRRHLKEPEAIKQAQIMRVGFLRP